MAENFFGTMAVDVSHEIEGRPDIPSLLWHYTSSDGLLGIVGKHSLRFTEATYMNDGSELIYGVDLFREVNASFMSDKPEDHRYAATQLENSIKEAIRHFSSVIFCMCAEQNLLNQWRDYGKDVVPYCIGFDPKFLADSNKFNFPSYLSKVIYDRDLQMKIMFELFSRIYRKSLEIPKFGSLTDEEAAPFISDAAIQFIAAILLFKNPAFAAEREWRLITHVPDVSSRVPREFRSSPLGVIPFFTGYVPESTHICQLWRSLSARRHMRKFRKQGFARFSTKKVTQR